MKVKEHVISLVTRFKYVGFILQNDGEIEGVNYIIQLEWLKRRGSHVFYAI